jgi:hypothetical protein
MVEQIGHARRLGARGVRQQANGNDHAGNRRSPRACCATQGLPVPVLLHFHWIMSVSISRRLPIVCPVAGRHKSLPA